MAYLNLLAKLGFAILVIVSIAILIDRVTQPSYFWEDDPAVEELIVSSTSVPTKTNNSILDEEFGKCLTVHSKLDYFSEIKLQNVSNFCLLPHGQCMHHALIYFCQIMESLGVKLWLIEPSILFCLMSSSRKYNLLTRGFIPANVKGSRNVMTFGTFQTSTELLNKLSAFKQIKSAGFRMVKYSKWSKFEQSNDSEDNLETLHYFFIQQDIVMHLIVFYPRKAYLWHPGLTAPNLNSKGLLYTNDGAYDNFTVMSMHLDTVSTSHIYIPSDSRCFLLEFLSATFLECNATSLNTRSILNPTTSSRDSLQSRALSALKELKRVLGSQMVSFWLWSKTLLGWFEKCDILHYSSGLELSIAMKSVDGYNFSSLFADSQCQIVQQNFDLLADPNVELNCQGMSVNISILYENKTQSWYRYNDEQSAYRLTFPLFTICSTDVLGQKVNIPCETSEIFETEYGQKWRNMSLSFDLKDMINLSPEES